MFRHTILGFRYALYQDLWKFRVKQYQIHLQIPLRTLLFLVFCNIEKNVIVNLLEFPPNEIREKIKILMKSLIRRYKW